MSKSKHTSGPWVNGYGNGLTGPTTPVISGPTVGEAIAKRGWTEGKRDYPYSMHIPISKGFQTIAIVPTMEILEDEITNEQCEANARLIAAAPDLLLILEEILRLSIANANTGGDKALLLGSIGGEARAAIARAKGNDDMKNSMEWT